MATEPPSLPPTLYCPAQQAPIPCHAMPRTTAGTIDTVIRDVHANCRIKSNNFRVTAALYTNSLHEYSSDPRLYSLWLWLLLFSSIRDCAGYDSVTLFATDGWVGKWKTRILRAPLIRPFCRPSAQKYENLFKRMLSAVRDEKKKSAGGTTTTSAAAPKPEMCIHWKLI